MSLDIVIFCMPSMPIIMDAFMSRDPAASLCICPMGMLADGAIAGLVCACAGTAASQSATSGTREAALKALSVLSFMDMSFGESRNVAIRVPSPDGVRMTLRSAIEK